MDKSSQKKRRGGAEKERERKKKRLAISASECRKISDIFKTDSKPCSQPEKFEGESSSSESPIVSEVEHVTLATGTSKISTTDSCLEAPLTEVDAPTASSASLSSPIQSFQSDGSLASTSNERCSSTSYFSKPHGDDGRSQFWSYHPHQKTDKAVVKRSFIRKDGSNRSWLSYNEENHSLHCSVCIAFSNSSDKSNFINGMTDWRHVHVRVEEHERTELHLRCSAAYLVERQQSSISHFLTRSLHEEVKRKREMMERIVDVVKLIGKRGLSYRGTSEEAAYTLDSVEADHGTFLEIIKLLRKYDSRTDQHLTEVIQKSKRRHSDVKSSRGRGSLVTLLSKTTVNSVITVIRDNIRQWISSDIKDMFAVELDTTQDISTQDQCSVVIRYVDSTANIKERLVAVLKCKETTGKAFVELLSEVMTAMKLELRNCVGSSTDGAANMQGKYNGFSTLLSKEAPMQIHVWCHAHVLNLVLAEATSTVVASVSLFALLNDIAVFFRESYQRMNIWSMQSTTMKRLNTIGATRWWSKDAALRKMFGSFNQPAGALYVDVLTALNAILADSKIQAVVKAKANGYIESLLKFETIVTAQVFLRIFSYTSPLSKYLQTIQLDLLTVHRMVEDLLKNMNILRNDFQTCHAAAKQFIEWANDKLEKTEVDLILEGSFPVKRQRQKKCMVGERCQDEAVSTTTPTRKYEIDVYNVIMDSVINNLERRLDRSSTLYADLSLLHPRNFNQLPSCTGAMEEVSKHLQQFDKEATAEQLRTELQSIAGQWSTLKQSLGDAYSACFDQNDSDSSESESGQDTTAIPCSSSTASCKSCPLCCYKVLHDLSLFTDAYKNIGLAYKLLLTLPVSQVACERSFSSLKLIKNRLRSTMTQEHLEAFMLMSVEKDILAKLNNGKIVDAVAYTSKELRRILAL